jgi:hypothetical protein
MDASITWTAAVLAVGGVGYYVEGGAFYDAPNDPDEAKLTAGLKFAKKRGRAGCGRAVDLPQLTKWPPAPILTKNGSYSHSM